MKPQDLFGQLVHFLGILLPGSLVVALLPDAWLKVFAGTGVIGDAVPLILAYLIGQFLYAASSLAWRSVERRLPTRDSIAAQVAMPLVRLLDETVHRRNEHDLALRDRAVAMRLAYEPDLGKEHAGKAIDDWCREFIAVRNPGLAAEIALQQSTAKLFRSLAFLFFPCAPLVVLAGMPVAGGVGPRGAVGAMIAGPIASCIAIYVFIGLRSHYKRRELRVALLLEGIRRAEKAEA